MSSVVVKCEEEIIDTNGYNSEDVDEDLNLTFDDSGGELQQHHHRVGYFRFGQHHKDSSHVLSPSTAVSSQQAHRKEMNITNGGNEQTTAGVKNPSTKSILDSEKRIRREIANSNERRRMQSINAGFQNLRALLPRHEGEKLSKAAILQQTSQYICDLEQQKTQLLSQNSQLKRTLGQHEIGVSGGYGGGPGKPDDGCSGVKKRKLTDNVISLQTISDSSDEGLGSVSPEPTTLLQASNASAGVPLGITKNTHGTAYVTHSAKELIELKKQLEKERRARAVIEEELRQIKRQLFAENYIVREVIEHTDNVREEDGGTVTYIEPNDKNEHTEVIVCSSMDEINDDCTEIVTDDHIHEKIILAQDDAKYADSTTLQPILQAAIKAQPKVEVERINETVMKITPDKDVVQVSQKKSTNNSIGLTRSRQNLETIVEAIRHLEGDHLFGESGGQQKSKAQKSQESPLALTTKQMVSCTPIQPIPHQHQQQQQQQRKTIAELRPFLQLKNPKIAAAAAAIAATNVVTIVKGKPMTVTAGTTAASRSDNTNMSVSNTTVVSAVPSSSNISVVSTNTSNSLNISSSSSSSSNNNTTNSMIPTNNTALPTAIVKVQTTSPLTAPSMSSNTSPPSHITITTASLKQCRPGVIVAKQIS